MPPDLTPDQKIARRELIATSARRHRKNMQERRYRRVRRESALLAKVDAETTPVAEPAPATAAEALQEAQTEFELIDGLSDGPAFSASIAKARWNQGAGTGGAEHA